MTPPVHFRRLLILLNGWWWSCVTRILKSKIIIIMREKKNNQLYSEVVKSIFEILKCWYPQEIGIFYQIIFSEINFKMRLLFFLPCNIYFEFGLRILLILYFEASKVRILLKYKWKKFIDFCQKTKNFHFKFFKFFNVDVHFMSDCDISALCKDVGVKMISTSRFFCISFCNFSFFCHDWPWYFCCMQGYLRQKW